MTLRALSVFAALLLVGCGGRVSLGEHGGPDADDNDIDAALSPPDATPVEIGPAPACRRTNDHFEMSVSGAGLDASCDAGPTERTFTGAILSVDTSLVKVDVCHPAADCTPMIVTVAAKAPGLDLRKLKVGSFVRVSAQFRRSWTCMTMFSIASVAEWGGVKNPVDGNKTYLVASEGTAGWYADRGEQPFNIDLVKTGCISGKTCTGRGVDWYKLQFMAIGGLPTTLGMGETGTFSAGGQTFTARNLRSFDEGVCHAYDFAWFATSF